MRFAGAARVATPAFLKAQKGGNGFKGQKTVCLTAECLSSDLCPKGAARALRAKGLFAWQRSAGSGKEVTK